MQEEDNINYLRIGVGVQLLTEEYIFHMMRWRNQPEIKSYFIHDGDITEEQQLKWWEDYQKDDKYYSFIATDANNIPIGSVSLYVDLDYKIGEFGRLMIGEKSAWGKGYGTMITGLTCSYGFENLNLDMIYLEVFEDNERAIKAYDKVGFATKETKEERGKIMLVMALHKTERK